MDVEDWSIVVHWGSNRAIMELSVSPTRCLRIFAKAKLTLDLNDCIDFFSRKELCRLILESPLEPVHPLSLLLTSHWSTTLSWVLTPPGRPEDLLLSPLSRLPVSRLTLNGHLLILDLLQPNSYPLTPQLRRPSLNVPPLQLLSRQVSRQYWRWTTDGSIQEILSLTILQFKAVIIQTPIVDYRRPFLEPIVLPEHPVE